MLGENDAKLENERLASEESKGYRYLCLSEFFHGSSSCWCLFFFTSVEQCLLIMLIIKHPQQLPDLPIFFKIVAKLNVKKKKIKIWFFWFGSPPPPQTQKIWRNVTESPLGAPLWLTLFWPREVIKYTLHSLHCELQQLLQIHQY